MRLSQKLSLGICAIVTTMMVTVILIGNDSIGRAIEGKIRKDLLKAQEVFTNFRQSRFEQLSTINQIATEIPQLRAVVNTPDIDHATILDTLQEIQRITKSSLFMITNEQGILLASFSEPERHGDDLSADPVVAAALAGKQSRGIWSSDGAIYQVICSPVVFDETVVGALMTGYVIDQHVLHILAEMTDFEIQLIAGGKLLKSTQAAGSQSKFLTLGPKELTDLGIAEAARGQEASTTILTRVIDGEKYLILTIPLLEDRKDGLYVLAHSLDQDLLFYKESRRWIIVFACFLLLSFLFLGMMYSRRITRPIDILVAGTRQIARGDLASRVKVSSSDEIGQLAHSFNQMVDNLQKTTVSKDYVDNIITSMADVLLVVESDGKIKTVNRATLKLSGYTEKELIGRNVALFFTEGGEQSKSRELQELFKKGVMDDYETDLIKKDGRKVPVLLSGAVMRDQHETLTGFVMIAKDITLRKENELHLKNTFKELQKTHDELKSAQQQLLHSEKMASIGQLAAGVAHEINNPVGFISSNIQTLKEYLHIYQRILGIVGELKAGVDHKDMDQAAAVVSKLNAEEEKSNLEFINKDIDNLLQESLKGVERIKVIVSDLRTFAREDPKYTKLVQIEEVIDGVLGIVQSETKYKAELIKEYGKTSPVLCHPQQLGQVFINLIINAVQAIDGQGTITIKTYEDKGGFVCAQVIDTGKGIPQEVITKIFDPFFTTKPVGEGTGLGLSISYEIIKKIGGTITVDSVVGKGTTFTVMLMPPEVPPAS